MAFPRFLIWFLTILFAVTVSNAATRTWTGAGSDNRFTTAVNWAEMIAPAAGDDLVFPTIAAQYSVFNNMFPDQVLHSLTIQGGNYSFVGAGKTLGIRVDGGHQELGTNLWTLNGTLFVNTEASVTAVIFGRDSNFIIDGSGTTSIRIQGSSGGVITKQGAGAATVTLANSGINSITVNSGRFFLNSSASIPIQSFIVNGGYAEVSGLQANIFRVTGSTSEFRARSVSIAFSLEISNGATYSPARCGAYLAAQTSPVLTGAMFDPLSMECPGNRDDYLIYNSSNNAVTDSFVNYPEGTTFTLGGRLFRITYRGGDGNDVQIIAVPGAPFDFNGDRRTDISVFRPADGTWYVQNPSGFTTIQWGISTDVTVPADYDGDGRSDMAVYRPSEGTWYVLESLNSVIKVIPFGLPTDIPVPADYDGDGIADPAVFRPSTGEWWIDHSSAGLSVTAVTFGTNGDVPVAGDYDGDGKSDLAVFRPSTGTWYIRGSRSGSFGMRWGQTGDKPVPADYDGDGKIDIAIFRPSQGVWYQFLSASQAPTAVFWGTMGDVPVPGDYDGDGKADLAIYRPSDGNWWINGSTSGIAVQPFGRADDRPIPASFIR